jgi:hypothetical protein
MSVIISATGYSVYVNSVNALEVKADETNEAAFASMVAFANSAPYIYIGYGGEAENKPFWLDDFSVYRNTITATEMRVPVKSAAVEPFPDPIYFNDFERGLNGATIIGGGSLQTDDVNFGTVFQNIGGAMRTNYLLLPSNSWSKISDTKELTVTFWVNAKNAGGSSVYQWAPLFMAYSAAPTTENTSPMFAAQYRGVLQVNHTTGWSDYTDAQNDQGANTIYQNDKDWLADNQWHLYSVVMTETTATVYFDGVVANSWTLTGDSNGSSVGDFFTSPLPYICLGGNQAWNWGDNDPGFAFDDFAMYNKALTPAQLKKIMDKKTLPEPIYYNDFEYSLYGSTIVGGGSVQDQGGSYGRAFQNITGGMRTNYLLLPSDSWSKMSTTNEVTVAFWVNAKNAGGSDAYNFAPLFMAYSAAPTSSNGMPMFAAQYRGLLQVNHTTGWSDFTDAVNDLTKNTEYNAVNNKDWLADNEWHLYTMTMTPKKAAVYFDGEVANSWTLSGTGDNNSVGSFFSDPLPYICVAGNQAWDWGDNDPGFLIDDILIFNKVLTPAQIAILLEQKK